MRFTSHAGFFASERLLGRGLKNRLGRGLKETSSGAALRKPAGRTVRPGKNAVRIPRRLLASSAPVGARPQRNPVQGAA